MIPEIKLQNGIPTLYVNDEPFFCLSGEIHNSSSSSLEYMEQRVWPHLADLNMNSVIVPIFWETIEPVEGEYDFTLIDGLIAQAREHNMKLIFLWFGLWKNSESFYVPGWMKKDTDTYFRVRKVNGDPINTISPLCEAAIAKDANVFSKIMAHIKEADEKESTVIVIQVENEIGLLGTACDYCDEAKAAFAEPVPAVLTDALGLNAGIGWREAFGDDAEESFMCYYFAKAVEQITAAGRARYPLPCYANSWLKQYPWYAGSYPSGGPVPEMQPIWKAVAPSLFTLAPDIYVPYVPQIMEEYTKEGNPLFIPEVRKDAVTASYCMAAFGKYNAICYSPFGIEDMDLAPEEIDKPPMDVMIALNIDPSAFDIEGSKAYLKRMYGLMNDMKPLYLKYRGTDKMKCYCRTGETDYGTYFKFKNYDLHIAYSPRMPLKPLAAGMIYELEDDKFLIVGMMSNFTFRPKNGENKTVDMIRLEEGEIVNGEWKPGRIMNGDEKMSLNCGDMAQCFLVELYKY